MCVHDAGVGEGGVSTIHGTVCYVVLGMREKHSSDETLRRTRASLLNFWGNF